jgi:hypothetical protein
MDVLDASLLSGGCGTGGVSIDSERRVASALAVAASLLRGDPMPAEPVVIDTLATTTTPSGPSARSRSSA